MDAREQIETELKAATDRARDLVDNTPGRLFTVRPAPTQWSAAECIAHLSISSQMFLPVLRNALDDARTRQLTGGDKPRMDVLGRILRWFLEPPVRTRVKTTTAFVPKSTRAKSEALAEFISLQRQLVDLLHASNDLPIGKIKIISPFDKRVRYNIYSAFLIVTAHQRRHLWQAEQAVQSLRKTPTAA